MSTEPTWEQLAVKAKELVADIKKMRKPAWKPAFKVGQRVRQSSGSPGEWTIGIVDTARQRYAMTCDTYASWREDELEPVPWSLQPPPFGEWHRSDGWKEEWLSDGWRPVLLGESEEGSQWYDEYNEEWRDSPWAQKVMEEFNWRRTRKPLPPPPDPEREAFESAFAPFTAEMHFTKEDAWKLWQAARKSRS